MDVREFKDGMKELEQDRENDIATDPVLERFALEHLPELDMEDSTPADILSPRTIAILFERGMLQLNQRSRGGVFTISSGRVIDVSSRAEVYTRLFDRWQKLGWIHMEWDQSGDISAIHLSVRPKS